MRFVLSLILISSVVACDTTRKTSNESPSTSPEVYSYEISKIEKKDPACKEEAKCASVTITYSDFNEGPQLHGTIDKLIRSKVNSKLQDFILDGTSSTKTEELISLFFAGYQKFKTAFPESITPWHIEVDVVTTFTHPDFISLSVTTSSYTGGAHPNNTVEYLNISSDGKLISDPDYFISDLGKVKAVAEGLFRKKYGLAPDQDLSEEGFIFEDNTFTLPENFGFSEAGIIFYYNSYEIAPHAVGPTVLLVPMEDISGYLRFK